MNTENLSIKEMKSTEEEDYSGYEEGKEDDLVIESAPPLVPDGGYAWFVVLSSWIVHLIIGGVERSSGIIYLRFLEEYQHSAAVTAWVTAIPSAIRLILGPVCSAVSNQFSCRSVVIAGSIVFAITMIMTAYAPNLEFLFFSFGFLSGIGRSFCYAPAVMMVGVYFNRRRGIAVGLSTSGVGVGTFAFPPFVEFLFSYYGHQGAFLILTGVVLNLAVCGALLRPLHIQQKLIALDRRKKEKTLENGVLLHFPAKDSTPLASNLSLNFEIHVNPPEEKLQKNQDKSLTKLNVMCNEENEKSTCQNGHVKEGTRFSKFLPCISKKKDPKKPKTKFIDFSLLKNFRFFSFCIAILLYTLAFQSAFVFLPAYGKQIGQGDMKSAYLVVITGVLDAVGRLLSGFILDLKQVKPYRAIIYNIVMYLTGVVAFIIPNTTSYIQLCVVCAFFGLLFRTYISQKSVLIVDFLGAEKLINSFGLMICFQGVGTLIGPPLAGCLKDINGKYDYAFITGGVAMILGAIILTIANVHHAYINRKRLSNNPQPTTHHD